MAGSTFTTDIVLGERYRDTVSGFEGTATATYFFLHGCERVLLEQYDTANAEMKELTFDAPRLVATAAPDQPITSSRTGGWKPEPPKRGPVR